MHVIEGACDIQVDEISESVDTFDTLSIPNFAQITIKNKSSTVPAFIFIADDRPALERLGYYEIFH
jgi:gentisate 1,2-dioxygenase